MALLLDRIAHCASSCCYWSFWNQQQYSRTGTHQALQFSSIFLDNINPCSVLMGGYLVQLETNTVTVQKCWKFPIQFSTRGLFCSWEHTKGQSGCDIPDSLGLFFLALSLRDRRATLYLQWRKGTGSRVPWVCKSGVGILVLWYSPLKTPSAHFPTFFCLFHFSYFWNYKA